MHRVNVGIGQSPGLWLFAPSVWHSAQAHSGEHKVQEVVLLRALHPTLQQPLSLTESCWPRGLAGFRKGGTVASFLCVSLGFACENQGRVTGPAV